MNIIKKHSKLKIALIILIGLNLVAGFFLYKRLYRTMPHAKASNKKISYFINRQQYFEVFPKDTNAIVFLGSSLTQNFELVELLKNRDIKNRGINGDITAGVLNRLTPIIESHPKKIFIEIGINDLGRGIAKEDVISNFKKIIDTLYSSCPATTLYVQSLLPVANSSETLSSFCSPKINADIRAINTVLKQYAAQRGITFIDTYNSFVLDDHINPKYAIYDGVHLTGEAYLLWSKILKPFVDN